MLYRAILTAILCLILSAAGLAQSLCSRLDVPVNVIRASGEPVQGLKASDFSGQMKKQAVLIQSVSHEASPRRILFVIDTTRQLSADARRAEATFVSGVVKAAQPGDNLALLTARGITQQVKFGEERPAITKALAVLEQGAEESVNEGKNLGVMDAVAEGINWFGEPRLGDTVVLLAKDLEGNHKTDYRNVAKMLEGHHVRLFGVAFGHLLLNNPTSASMAVSRDGFGYVQPGIPLHTNETGEANFFPLSVNSGGYIVREDPGLAQKQFKLDDLKRKQLEKTGALMAQLIDESYNLRVESSTLSNGGPFMVSVKEGQQGTHVLYPHEISCGVLQQSPK